jgi:hypothetical protein
VIQINPPGDLNDFDDAGKKAWSEMISRFLDRNIAQYDLPQFFNPTRDPIGGDAVERKIDWTAFPKLVTENSGGSDILRWTRADRNRFTMQDEYCEWHVERNNDGKIVRVTFTSEGPEYWEFLADHSPDKLVALYQELVDPAVVLEDLVDGNGIYVRQNRWNDPRRGGKIAHLAHVNNTLGAFVNIGARSTIIRHRQDGTIMTGEAELIDCGGYGARDRHSDPHIGGEVNALARMHARITMANPVGLSMDGLFPLGWETPDGSNPKDYWAVVRGTETHQMRTVYEVPAEKGFVVGDIKISGREINFGGQIADFIRVKLVGLAHEFGQHETPSRQCIDISAEAELVASISASELARSTSDRLMQSLAGSTRS